MNHAERYEYLVNKMAAIRWRGSDLDASYHAALFLMASHPALFQKMDRYLCPEGIDFTKMVRVFLQRLSKKARNINGFRAFGKWRFSAKAVFQRLILGRFMFWSAPFSCPGGDSNEL